MPGIPGEPADLRVSRVAGVSFVFGAYFLYALGDAAAKWLVGTLSAWEVLFVRSWLGLLVCLALGGRAAFQALRRMPSRHDLAGMNLANFGGWAAYYSAAAYLPLPQLYAGCPVTALERLPLLLKPTWLNPCRPLVRPPTPPA